MFQMAVVNVVSSVTSTEPNLISSGKATKESKAMSATPVLIPPEWHHDHQRQLINLQNAMDRHVEGLSLRIQQLVELIPKLQQIQQSQGAQQVEAKLSEKFAAEIKDLKVQIQSLKEERGSTRLPPSTTCPDAVVSVNTVADSAAQPGSAD